MTDAFEKLAELVGASVEAAPSQGLPRTRAEALALGLTRYFTGKPCKHWHVVERYVFGGCVECMRQRGASKAAKDARRKYSATPRAKELMARRNADPEAIARRRLFDVSPSRKERKRQRDHMAAEDAVLFAVNQAERAARRTFAPADILPQCPEPHRSQLQALIDRIRADPAAGKAVVGLLQSMRNLRKLELAETAAQHEQGE